MAGVKVRGEIYRCLVCGNVIEVLSAGGGELVCCNKPMQIQTEQSTETGTEKHLPVVVLKNDITEIVIGEVPHPMELGHFIEWVEIKTYRQTHRHYFSPNDEPKTGFKLVGEKVLSVKAYCNVHGLWCKVLDN
jgi:superoxide reductase